jgi:hypothetical protein
VRDCVALPGYGRPWIGQRRAERCGFGEGGGRGMGTSYQGLLVVGDLETVAEALAEGGVTAYVATAATGRIAVIPKGDPRWNVVDLTPIAVLLSGPLGLPVLAHDMYDSDRLALWIFQRGVITHEYISDMASVGNVDETGEGFTRTVDGVTYGLNDSNAPRGPRGADPDKLAPFGVGTIDKARLGALLVSAADWVFANELHAAIAEALNLDPNPLMVAYHWFERGEIEQLDAVHVTPR